MATPKWYNAHEFYETPATFTRHLFDTVEIRGRCFEPCVGSGAILRDSFGVNDPPRGGGNSPRRWVTNDIDPRWKADHHHDATSPAVWAKAGPIDWVVTNSAFSIGIPVLALALEYAREGVAMYFRLSIHEPLKTGDRRDFLEKHPPSMIDFLPRFAYRRSPKTGKWTTDSMTACWVVWDKTHGSQHIRYAPTSVLDELDRETPTYRARMDKLVGKRYRKPKGA